MHWALCAYRRRIFPMTPGSWGHWVWVCGPCEVLKLFTVKPKSPRTDRS